MYFLIASGSGTGTGDHDEAETAGGIRQRQGGKMTLETPS